MSLVELSIGAHKIINAPGVEDQKQKHAMEQYLITLRNEFLTQSISANTMISNSFNNLRNQMSSLEGNHMIARGVSDLMNAVQSDLSKGPLFAQTLRNKFSDILRILDPESQPL